MDDAGGLAAVAAAAGEAAPTPASAASVRSRALRASAWVIGAKPLGMAMQTVRSLVLTRLLFPEAFGLMALVGVVMQGIQMCSDVGIGPAIIKSARGDDERFLQTAWTLQIMRGIVLWLLCCAAAWPFAALYHEPMLLALLPVAGLNAVIAGFNTTAWQSHDRAMKRGRLTVLALVVGALNLLVMVAAAWWLRSVWALVIGGLAGSLISLLLGFAALPGIRHRLHWDKRAAHELVHFGKWVFVSTLLTFFAMQSDKLLLGKLIPIGLLGIYSISMVLASQPQALVGQIASLVLFPALAEKFRADSGHMHQRFSRARGTILRLALLLCMGVVVAAPLFFGYLYDARYVDAGWIAQLLALSGWATILNQTSGYALLAFGDSKTLALGNLANVIVTVLGAVVGFRLIGLPGFIIGYATGTTAGEVIQGVRIRRLGVGVFRQDLTFTLVGLAAAGAYIGATVWFGTGTTAVAALSRGLAGLFVWLALAVCLLPAVKRELAPNLRLPLLGRRACVAGVR